MLFFLFFFFQAEDGIRDLVRSRGLGDVYKRQVIELDRLGRRLKVLAALGAGTAAASVGRLFLDRGDGPRTGAGRRAAPRSRAVQSRTFARRSGLAGARRRRRR